MTSRDAASVPNIMLHLRTGYADAEKKYAELSQAVARLHSPAVDALRAGLSEVPDPQIQAYVDGLEASAVQHAREEKYMAAIRSEALDLYEYLRTRPSVGAPPVAPLAPQPALRDPQIAYNTGKGATDWLLNYRMRCVLHQVVPVEDGLPVPSTASLFVGPSPGNLVRLHGRELRGLYNTLIGAPAYFEQQFDADDEADALGDGLRARFAKLRRDGRRFLTREDDLSEEERFWCELEGFLGMVLPSPWDPAEGGPDGLRLDPAPSTWQVLPRVQTDAALRREAEALQKTAEKTLGNVLKAVRLCVKPRKASSKPPKPARGSKWQVSGPCSGPYFVRLDLADKYYPGLWAECRSLAESMGFGDSVRSSACDRVRVRGIDLLPWVRAHKALVLSRTLTHFPEASKRKVLAGERAALLTALAPGGSLERVLASGTGPVSAAVKKVLEDVFPPGLASLASLTRVASRLLLDVPGIGGHLLVIPMEEPVEDPVPMDVQEDCEEEEEEEEDCEDGEED